MIKDKMMKLVGLDELERLAVDLTGKTANELDTLLDTRDILPIMTNAMAFIRFQLAQDHNRPLLQAQVTAESHFYLESYFDEETEKLTGSYEIMGPDYRRITNGNLISLRPGFTFEMPEEAEAPSREVSWTDGIYYVMSSAEEPDVSIYLPVLYTTLFQFGDHRFN